MAFVRHIACPSCRKNGGDRDGNNLAIYEDGEYCFSCHYSKKKTTKAEEPKINKRDFEFCKEIPSHWLEWLSKFRLTEDQITKHFAYDLKSERLALYSNDYFEMRSLTQEPKVISVGSKPIVCWPIFPPDTSLVILVEDGISALRVSQVIPCLPLFGSNVSSKMFATVLKYKYKPLIWLDKDKIKEARNIRDRFIAQGLESAVIFSPKDPKYYMKYEIRTFIKKTGFQLPPLNLLTTLTEKAFTEKLIKMTQNIPKKAATLGTPPPYNLEDHFYQAQPLKPTKLFTDPNSGQIYKITDEPEHKIYERDPDEFRYYSEKAELFYGYGPNAVETNDFRLAIEAGMPFCPPYTANMVEPPKKLDF
jgi:hypothetical protein